ncbi:MAG: ROK family protein [Propionibacteriaceae bacterium]|jgi:predicted NBD/HSP70 family sugar kinase|nr:ROK family protein [Propionibacteriaceae bacterium]
MDVRTANLSTVLTHLYLNGPTSRSQLSAATGLNRSTIASLVSDLDSLGLVEENEPRPNGTAGRPSPVVSTRPDVAVVAVNPEIDVLTVSLVALDGTLIQGVEHPFSKIPAPDEVIALTASIIKGFRAGRQRILGIGVAVPGLVDSEGVIADAPHLRWKNVPFTGPLSEATGLPTSAANDAGLGAVAEYKFGAGRGVGNLLYLNGGASGIGGGLVAGGKPLRGGSGFAGELGHVRVSSSNTLDSAGLPGTLEAMVSRDALMSASNKDETATRQVKYLARGLAVAANLLNPEMVVLGGFLSTLLAHNPMLLRCELERAALRPSSHLEIAPSALEPNQLAVGAADMAFAPLLAEVYV